MSDLNFIIMGDRAFFHTVRYSVEQIGKFYPGARVFIYDWGFTESQFLELGKGHATIVPWNKKIGYTPPRAFIPENQLTPMVMAKFYLKRWIFRPKFKRLQRSLFIFAQKPMCILDCLRRSEGNLVFLDADAFLIDRIDDVFDHDFNVGVTLRRQHEIEFPQRDGECRALNVGVMFFKGSTAVLEAFIQRWNEEIAITRDYCIEQTALSNIVATTREDIYDGYNKTGILAAEGEEIKIKVLPCETYNYNWIEEGFDRKKNKILHFKGARHGREHFDDLRKKIRLDEKIE